MSRPARYIKDLDTDDIIARLEAYMKLQGQCVRALEARGEKAGEILTQLRYAFENGRNPAGHDEDEETAAMDWLRFIVAESFDPVFHDPAEELIRIQRYLVTASLVATEAPGLPDET